MEKTMRVEEIKHETESKVREGRKIGRVSKEGNNVKENI
jgi:hypothetical protein